MLLIGLLAGWALAGLREPTVNDHKLNTIMRTIAEITAELTQTKALVEKIRLEQEAARTEANARADAQSALLVTANEQIAALLKQIEAGEAPAALIAAADELKATLVQFDDTIPDAPPAPPA